MAPVNNEWTSNDDNGATPLHTAAQNGSLKDVKMLLGRGADPTVANDDGSTPLHAAAQNGHLNIAKFLLNKGADLTVADNGGATPLHSAAQNGHLKVVELFLIKRANLAVADNDGATPLHEAVFSHHLKIAKLLLGKGADLTVAMKDGRTPLYAAAQQGYLEIVELLLDKGADVTVSTNLGQTPLYVAVYNGHFEVVKRLLDEGADPAVAASGGETPLHVAVFHGHLEIVKLLLREGANLTAAIKDGRTPLYIAAQQGFLEIVELLLGEGADVTISTNLGKTPLYVAAYSGHLEVAELLLSKGADPTVVTNKGQTPLQAAAQNGHFEVAKLLEEPEEIQIMELPIGEESVWKPTPATTGWDCWLYETKYGGSDRYPGTAEAAEEREWRYARTFENYARAESEESYSSDGTSESPESELIAEHSGWVKPEDEDDDKRAQQEARARRNEFRKRTFLERLERRRENSSPKRSDSAGRPKKEHDHEQQEDLEGLREYNPPLPSSGPIESFNNYFTEKHSCELCEQSSMDQALQFLGQRQKLCDSLSELREKAKSCKAHMVILSSIEPYAGLGLSEINVFAENLSLSTEVDPTETVATGLLRVFVDLGPSAEIMGVKREIPVLPESRSEFDFLLYRQWLRACNIYHKHTSSYFATLPSRVIDVGDSDSNYIRLRVTNQKARGIYIALSHRWQNGTPTTITDTIGDRRKAIELNSLPQAYRDVVRITRKLGIQFLWIDSLCIVQDDQYDWLVEADRMESYYALAYCTIAVSSASEVHGSFEQDVENGELSQRAWILQERALSRRTIHCTGKQTYWECGTAIWSKTADNGMKPQSILSSSEFPKLDFDESSKEGRVVFRDLFTRYTNLSMTVKSDRPVAVVGMEYRLVAFCKSVSMYGIVRSFFGESLLWHRSGNEWMEPLIKFKDNVSSWSVSGKNVPSWSWMSYSGGMRYGTICTDGLSWRTDFKFRYNSPRCTLSAPLVKILSSCRTRLCEDKECEIRDENEDVVGWIRYDCGYEDSIAGLRCIILARGTTGWREYGNVPPNIELLPGDFNYTLLLTSMDQSFEEAKGYRRLGVAVILERYLSPSREKALVF